MVFQAINKRGVFIHKRKNCCDFKKDSRAKTRLPANFKNTLPLKASKQGVQHHDGVDAHKHDHGRPPVLLARLRLPKKKKEGKRDRPQYDIALPKVILDIPLISFLANLSHKRQLISKYLVNRIYSLANSRYRRREDSTWPYALVSYTDMKSKQRCIAAPRTCGREIRSGNV
jgi:hypothetical protein